MLNARQKILNYIYEQQCTTVEELSRVFKVTPANIRHHLSILTQQGSVKVVGQRAQTAKGRPAQLYSTSQQHDVNNFDLLSDALLCALRHNIIAGDENHLLQEIASHIGSEFNTVSTNPTRRLYLTIRSLNRMNYQAHWEAHIENPRIMLGHCPYRTILDNHPFLCQLDKILIGNMLNAPVEQVEKLVPDGKGLPQCIFLIVKSPL